MKKSARSNKTESTWIVGAHIVTQNAKRDVFLGNIQIVDGRIAKITKTTKNAPKNIGKNTRVIQAQGKVVLPGFVQAHIHLCQTLFRNQADDLELLDWLSKRIWVMEAAHTHETLKTSALLGIHELLSSGTTCILDMGTVRHTSAIFEAVRDTGIRASVGKCLMDHPKTTPPNLRESTRDALAEAKLLHKIWHGSQDDRIRVSYAPRFVISCTEELLSEVARLSREQDAIIHTHASENLKEIQMVKKLVNCENIEYLDQLGLTSKNLVLAHCIWLKPNEMELLRRSGTHVVHCPSSNMKLASGLARVPEMQKKGINVALGADGAPCNNNLNIFGEMRLAALLHKPGNGPKSMRAQTVLDMATRDGAKALGWFDDIGSIEVGKKADLVALDLMQPENTLPAPALFSARKSGPKSTDTDRLREAIASSIVYSAQPSHVEWTMVDGKQVYDRKKGVNAIARAALVKQVHKAQLEIWKKIQS